MSADLRYREAPTSVCAVLSAGGDTGFVVAEHHAAHYIMLMPDWTKRVTKERAEDLGSDEKVVAATYFQGRGSTSGQVAFGMTRGIGRNVMGAGAAADVIAARAGGTAGARSREGQDVYEGSLAAKLPDDKGVLAVTDSRIIVFGYSQGVLKTKILDPVAVIDRSDLVGWSFKSGKLAAVVNLAFSDDSAVGIEVPRANKPSQFTTTLGIPEAT